MRLFKIFTLMFIIISTAGCKDDYKNSRVRGEVFGTSYSIIYQGEENFESSIDSLFEVMNTSMSTYRPNSLISEINRSDHGVIDEHFLQVLSISREIYEETDGIFDPTIGILVNAWNFGPQGNIHEVDSSFIDSIKPFVGLNKVTVNGKNLQKPIQTYIDFNAIAKGYSVDLVANFLESKGNNNYLVEIGGEIRVKGENKESNKPWKVGVEEPHFDGSRSILKAISLKDESMATSGTYRKFQVDSLGNRYSHIIDPITGYPSNTNLLSISVIAPTCTYADGYATAFKAMGIEKVTEFLNSHPELKVFLIYENTNNAIETLSLNGFPAD